MVTFVVLTLISSHFLLFSVFGIFFEFLVKLSWSMIDDRLYSNLPRVSAVILRYETLKLTVKFLRRLRTYGRTDINCKIHIAEIDNVHRRASPSIY